MLKIEKILLPVDFPNTSLNVIHQAATLAYHFNSEIVMLHVVTAESHAAGVPDNSPDWDMLAEITGKAQKNLDESLGPDLEALAIRCVVLKGNPAQAILQTAQLEKADLIMMPSHGAAFNQFLLGSVTAKVLHGSECPVWTGGHLETSEDPLTADNPMLLYGGAGMDWRDGMQTIRQEEPDGPVPEFAIHNVLCAVDLGPCSNKAVSWAAAMATEYGARLTLAHVTASAKLWGPGGSHVEPKLREELVDGASQYLAKLQQEAGVKADTLIGSGDVPKALSQAAKQTKADLLVTGCYPYDGNLRIHGYAIICAVPIPLLSV
ncbi:MAG: universal stress protein [Candidatus Acidiferrales bacterium]